MDLGISSGRNKIRGKMDVHQTHVDLMLAVCPECLKHFQSKDRWCLFWSVVLEGNTEPQVSSQLKPVLVEDEEEMLASLFTS